MAVVIGEVAVQTVEPAGDASPPGATNGAPAAFDPELILAVVRRHDERRLRLMAD